MKTLLCSYSGYKIHPGHGKRLVKSDGRAFYFLSAKCERSHMMKRNPREISWTVLYRRKHKKGQQEEIQKRRSKRSSRFQRPIVGASLAEILAKRNQKPEVRKAQREQAIRAAKEKQRAKDAEKRSKKAPMQQAKGKRHPVARPVQTKAPRVGGKR